MIPVGGDDGALPPDLRRRVRDCGAGGAAARAGRDRRGSGKRCGRWRRCWHFPRSRCWSPCSPASARARALVKRRRRWASCSGRRRSASGRSRRRSRAAVWPQRSRRRPAPVWRLRWRAPALRASPGVAGLAVLDQPPRGRSGPAGVALWLLRGGAWHPLRAVAAGLAAGTVGLLVGEIGCERGLAHVLVYHLGFWLVAAATFLLATRWLRPRSFAP